MCENCIHKNVCRYKNDLRAKGQHPRNSLDNFNCPVCNEVSFPKKVDMQKVAIMDDGTEINC